MRWYNSRLGPMMVRGTDTDAVSCVVHALSLELSGYLSSGR